MRFVWVIALLLATAAQGQAETQATMPGRVLTAWIEAFNSADPERIRAFDHAHGREPAPLEQRLSFRRMTGGFTVLRIEKSEPLSIIALLEEKNSDTVARLEFSLNGEDPPKILNVSLLAVPRPPDLVVPRMTQAQALSALAARADELASGDEFSGALLIARYGKVLLQKAWGWASRGPETAAMSLATLLAPGPMRNAPATLDTQFRLGSMNKMFTAVAALQLVEAGKLRLDDVIGKYLPDYPNKDVASKVTVRHLLTHTGGTGDIFGPDFMAKRDKLREHIDYLKLYGSRALTHEPGARFEYSNYGFVLLAALIERVSGMPYYDYLRNKVFLPVGMKSTDSLPETDEVQYRAAGYMRQGDSWVSNAETLPWRGTGAGGGYSTVGDLLLFAQALGSGKLISRKMLVEATQPQSQEYGFGFQVLTEGKLRGYGHSGGAPGMSAELRIFPQLGYVIIALSNLDPPAASRLAEYFSHRMIEDKIRAIGTAQSAGFRK